MKLCFLDVECTGTDPAIHEICEVSMIIDIDKKPIKIINKKFRPTNFDVIEQKALDIQNITLKDLKKYPDRNESFKELIQELDKVVDKYDPADKMIAIAHNLWFDYNFIRHNLFEVFNQKYNTKHYYFSYFFVEGFDTIPLMTQLKHILELEFDNMKLGTLCKALKIDFDDNTAHNSLYDTKKMRKLFYRADKILEKVLKKKSKS